jgi:hypothetical protein
MDVNGETWANINNTIDDVISQLDEVARNFNDNQQWRKAIAVLDKVRAKLAAAVVRLEKQASTDEQATVTGKL